MPSTTVVIHEDQPLEALDQWDALINVAAGAAGKYMDKRAAKKSASSEKRIAAAQARAAAAQEQAAQAAALQRSSMPAWLPYVLIGIGVIAVGGVIILVMKK